MMLLSGVHTPSFVGPRDRSPVSPSFFRTNGGRPHLKILIHVYDKRISHQSHFNHKIIWTSTVRYVPVHIHIGFGTIIGCQELFMFTNGYWLVIQVKRPYACSIRSFWIYKEKEEFADWPVWGFARKWIEAAALHVHTRDDLKKNGIAYISRCELSKHVHVPTYT